MTEPCETLSFFCDIVCMNCHIYMVFLPHLQQARKATIILVCSACLIFELPSWSIFKKSLHHLIVPLERGLTLSKYPGQSYTARPIHTFHYDHTQPTWSSYSHSYNWLTAHRCEVRVERLLTVFSFSSFTNFEIVLNWGCVESTMIWKRTLSVVVILPPAWRILSSAIGISCLLQEETPSATMWTSSPRSRPACLSVSETILAIAVLPFFSRESERWTYSRVQSEAHIHVTAVPSDQHLLPLIHSSNVM